jgi:hypothetical protein
MPSLLSGRTRTLFREAMVVGASLAVINDLFRAEDFAPDAADPLVPAASGFRRKVLRGDRGHEP